MRTTTLGTDGPQVGVIGLGCMGMTHAYDLDTPRDDRQSIAVIHEALRRSYEAPISAGMSISMISTRASAFFTAIAFTLARSRSSSRSVGGS